MSLIGTAGVNDTGGLSRNKSNRKRVVRNMQGRNVSMKEKSPKEGLTSAEDLTIEPPSRGSPPPKISLTNITARIA